MVVNSGTHLYRSSHRYTPVQVQFSPAEATGKGEALGSRVDNARPAPDPKHHCPALTVWKWLVLVSDTRGER